MHGAEYIRQDLLPPDIVRNVLEEQRCRLVVGEQSGVLLLFILREMNVAPLVVLPTIHEVNEENHGHYKKCDARNDTSNEWRVDGLDGSSVARDLIFVQALAAVTLEQDAWITKDTRYQAIHSRLRERASIFLAIEGADRSEAGRSLDLLVEKVANVDTARLATQHATWNTRALDVLTFVARGVPRVCSLQIPATRVQRAVEALPLVHPELKVAFCSFRIAAKRRLGLLVFESVQDLAIRDVTYLVILLLHDSLPVTDAIFALGHQSVTGIVGLAHITVDARPAVLALAAVAFSWQSVLAICQRATQRLATVFAAKARRTRALAAALGAVAILHTLEVTQVAVKARRTVLGSLLAGEQLEGVVAGEEVIVRGGVVVIRAGGSSGGPW